MDVEQFDMSRVKSKILFFLTHSSLTAEITGYGQSFGDLSNSIMTELGSASGLPVFPCIARKHPHERIRNACIFLLSAYVIKSYS